MFESSPLFAAASKAVQRRAVQEFQRTSLGRLIVEAKRAREAPQRVGNELARVVERFSPGNTRDTIRILRGMQFGQFARQIEQYARGDTWRWVSSWLGGMGDAGSLIKALVSPGALLRDELQILHGVLQAFDMPDPLRGKSGAEVTSWARKHLEEQGSRFFRPAPRPRSDVDRR